MFTYFISRRVRSGSIRQEEPERRIIARRERRRVSSHADHLPRCGSKRDLRGAGVAAAHLWPIPPAAALSLI